MTLAGVSIHKVLGCPSLPLQPQRSRRARWLTSYTNLQPNTQRRGLIIAVFVALYAVVGYQVRPHFFHPHSAVSPYIWCLHATHPLI